MKRRKTAKSSYILFWVHWLPKYAPKSVKYRLTKFGWLTVRDPREEAKITLKSFFLTRKQGFRKTTKSTIKERKTGKMTYI